MERVAQESERDIVELDVRGAERAQLRELGPVDRRDIGEELAEVGVGAIGDPLTPAQEVLRRRARQRDLRRPARELPDEAELVGGDAAVTDEAAGHDRRPVPQLLTAGAPKRSLGVHLGEPAYRLPEVSEEDAAPVLAVGDDLEADFLLQSHRVPDASTESRPPSIA
jgi:hypothetical protein